MKKKKKKQETISTPDLLGRGATCVYLAVMLGIFPVFYHDNLFGISSVKRSFFLIVTAIYLCMMAIPFFGRILEWLKKKKMPGWKPCDIFAGLLLLSVIFSTIFALDVKEAILGVSVRKVGAIAMLLCLLVFYAVRNYTIFHRIWFCAYLAGSACIYLFGVLVTCGINVLNIQEGIDPSQLSMFVSPLGNININAAYISLMLPAAMVFFLLCKEKAYKWLLAAYLYLGFAAAVCIRSDSVIVVVFAVFVLFLYFALGNRDWLLQFTYTAGIYTAANLTVFLLRLCLKTRMYPFSGLGALVLKPQVICLELLVCGILFLICCLLKKKEAAAGPEALEQNMLRLRKWYGLLLLVLFAAGVIVLIGLNLFFRDAASGTALDQLILRDETGSGRGYIWIRTVELYGKLPLKHKIFGCGLSCFYNFVYPAYGADMLEKINSVFYDAHNDFLNMLATTGIVGIAAFFGLIGSAIVNAVRKWKEQPVQIAVVLALAAFLVQGLVNSYSIFTLPLLFIILGLSYSPILEGQAAQ